MDLRLTAAILLGKTISLLLKLKGSGATAAPGLYALKIDPFLVKKLSGKNKLKSIVISGTNGKTTTSRLIYEALKDSNKIIHNRAGSNLLRGVASTLIGSVSILGKTDAEIAIWETDEAALLPISQNVQIDTLVLLNLFRDQLDRYGEMDTTRKKWAEVVSALPASSILVLNSDDPSTNYLAKFSETKTVFFGVETNNINLPQIENVADVKYCINCGSKLTYQTLYSSHLGKYSCTKCGFKRNTPQIQALKIKIKPDFSSDLELSNNGKRLSFHIPLPGLYSVYNVLAACAVANIYNVKIDLVKNKIAEFAAVFGRFQKIRLKNTNVTTFLIKNPAGANEVIRTIAAKSKLNLLIALNDNIADGRDVSWIWDTNWEAIKSKVDGLTITGRRAHDLALRLKYAGIKTGISIEPDIKTALNKGVTKSGDLIILPTYTAMLKMQNYLKGEKWHKQ